LNRRVRSRTHGGVGGVRLRGLPLSRFGVISRAPRIDHGDVMTKRKLKTCTASRCEEPPYLGGLCKDHYEEWEDRRRREDAATQFLHSGVIDGRVLQHSELQDEFQQLSKWWGRVCQAVQTRRDTIHMPVEEADYAISWCTSIAQRIIEAEFAFRAGMEIPPPAKSPTRALLGKVPQLGSWAGQQRSPSKEIQVNTAYSSLVTPSPAVERTCAKSCAGHSLPRWA